MRSIIQSRKSWIIFGALLIILIILPVIGTPGNWLLYLFIFFIYLAMANMWNLLSGYSGLLSLCQPAFIGLAGYTTVIVTWSGLPFYIGILGGAIVAAVFAILISVPAFRLRGMYFAIGTLIVPEALRIIFLRWRPVGEHLVGGGAGYIIKGIGEVTMVDTYWLALVLVVVSVIVLGLILNSKFGLGLSAIRDNDRTAEGSGINVFRLKLYSFIISAFITGAAGAVFFIYQGYIEPISAFSIQWTTTLLLATIIGGVGTLEGPILGTIIIVILHFLLGRYGSVSLLIQGIILICVILLIPQGIMSFLRNTRIYKTVYRWLNG